MSGAPILSDQTLPLQHRTRGRAFAYTATGRLLPDV